MNTERPWMPMPVVVVVVLLAFLGGIWGLKRLRSDRGMAAGHQVINAAFQAGHRDTICRSLPDGISIVSFRYGRLHDGCAVMIDLVDAAFWVRGEQVYVVNDAARAILSDHPTAPPEITYDAVDTVAE